jgi:hypothetical protein
LLAAVAAAADSLVLPSEAAEVEPPVRAVQPPQQLEVEEEPNRPGAQVLPVLVVGRLSRVLLALWEQEVPEVKAGIVAPVAEAVAEATMAVAVPVETTGTALVGAAAEVGMLLQALRQ